MATAREVRADSQDKSAAQDKADSRGNPARGPAQAATASLAQAAARDTADSRDNPARGPARAAMASPAQAAAPDTADSRDSPAQGPAQAAALVEDKADNLAGAAAVSRGSAAAGSQVPAARSVKAASRGADPARAPPRGRSRLPGHRFGAILAMGLAAPASPAAPVS